MYSVSMNTNPEMVQLRATCPRCKVSDTVHVPMSEVAAFKNGASVQEAFVSLTADQREFFVLSHLCVECWENLFHSGT